MWCIKYPTHPIPSEAAERKEQITPCALREYLIMRIVWVVLVPHPLLTFPHPLLTPAESICY